MRLATSSAPQALAATCLVKLAKGLVAEWFSSSPRPAS